MFNDTIQFLGTIEEVL